MTSIKHYTLQAAVGKWEGSSLATGTYQFHTREECEEKLKVLIVEMKAEIAELKRQKAEGTLPSQELEKVKESGGKVRKASK